MCIRPNCPNPGYAGLKLCEKHLEEEAKEDEAFHQWAQENGFYDEPQEGALAYFNRYIAGDR